jgi:hypothetical protein
VPDILSKFRLVFLEMMMNADLSFIGRHSSVSAVGG